MESLGIIESHFPSEYERQAIREIQLWKEPKMGWFGAAVRRVNATLHTATELVRKVPGVDWTIENVVAGLLRLMNEIVQDTVGRDAVHARYRAAGHAIKAHRDIHALDLEAVDGLLDGMDMKYRTLAAAGGAAAGYAGAAGILPDIVSLVALNLRAAGEYAVHCGFDLADPSERLFALQILNAVSQPTDAAKQAALVPIFRVSHTIAREQTLQAVEHYAVTQAVRNAARALGVQLTERKLAQVVPVAGAVVGGGFNAYYTSKVCDAAYFIYRERLLLAKYGVGVVSGN